MRIIKKYYHKKNWKLRRLDKNRTNEPIFRFKILRDGKEFPCCDFKGLCTNKAYAEVFPMLNKNTNGWSYLCRKHYTEEQKRLHNNLPACLTVEW